MSTTTRRAALAALGTATLAACSGAQRGGSSSPTGDPAWLVALRTAVAFAKAVEPAACAVVAAVVPAVAPACAVAAASLTVLDDALAATGAAREEPSAVCAVRAAAERALAARLDVVRLLDAAGAPEPATASAVGAVVGMLSLALDALVPPCAPAGDAGPPSAPAVARVRAALRRPAGGAR